MLAEIQLSVAEAHPRTDRPRLANGLSIAVECLERSRQQLSIVAWVVSRTDILHCFSRGNIDVALINADWKMDAWQG